MYWTGLTYVDILAISEIHKQFSSTTFLHKQFSSTTFLPSLYNRSIGTQPSNRIAIYVG